MKLLCARTANFHAVLIMFMLTLPWLSGCLSFHRGSMPGEPAEATFAEVADARVRYLDVGEGPAVVLLHGFASSLETWAGVIPELQSDFRVLALDLKGFGWTDRPEGDYSPQAQARLVFELMDARGIEEAAVVAHSWGSSVALAMALEQPERVRRLALYDAWVYHEQLPTFFIWSRASGFGEFLFSLFYRERPDDKMALAFYDKRYVTEALVEDVEATLNRPGTLAAALEAVRGQRFEEIEHRYRNIDVPTLILWGREDVVTRLSAGERLSRELPQAELIVFPQCGHFPMIEALAASNRRLVDFLQAEEHRASRGGE